eukprot:TRINITY_DN9825_c0_g1_i1.p1 TRINITY_DN9825_c0_g1~~TRINITY_DN9825_c0_g1_i1.p1  ORF type:complete len:263 (+),score=73.43 TRINITY_DN9825_c0_g1_i1:66-854(+)
MVFVKVLKSSTYFSRFQVKWRRRREGKTNYRRRIRMVSQFKNKYATPKYRLVVRTTNTDIIAQICTAKLQGDCVHAAAYSHELPLHGAVAGLKNYAAAYATGLLLARRMLKKLHLDTKYEGKVEADGADFNVEPSDTARRPFKAIFDAGLQRTTTGARIFGVLKGALDGGIDIPHSEKRFPGFDKEKGDLDSETHRERIFAAHVADYQKKLQREEPEKYKEAFSKYIENGVKPDQIEDMWAECHASIRKFPDAKRFDQTFVV